MSDGKTKVVIIGANEFQDRLIRKAKERGYETHVFAWDAGDVGELSADYFYPISIVNKESILAQCRCIHPDAICSVASDLAVPTVNSVARKLGLVSNPIECDTVATNKFEMRAALQNAGLFVPWFMEANAGTCVDDIVSSIPSFPVIVKPTDRSGSRAVTRLDSARGIDEALAAAIGESFEGKAIIEGFVTGKEYSCEAISYNGHHSMLSITEKFTTEAPNYIEVGHLQPSGLPNGVIHNVWEVVSTALDALHIFNGASHTEFKIDDRGQITIIEVGARMGGDFIGSDLVPLSTGQDYLGMVLDVALGHEPRFTSSSPKRAAAVRFFMSADDVDFFANRNATNAGREYERTNHMPDALVRDSSSRFGSIIKTANERSELIEALHLRG